MKATSPLPFAAWIGALALTSLPSLLATAPDSATLRLLWVNESYYYTGQFAANSTPVLREDYLGMSADGTALIGNAGARLGVFSLGLNNQAFRRVGETREKLGFLPESLALRSSDATGISADGQVVVGSSGYWGFTAIGSPATGPQAFRWTAATGIQPLFTPRLPMSVALAASGDGSVVVGYYDLADSRRRAYRWSQAEVTQLEPLPGDAVTEAFCVSGDGRVIIGSSGDVNGYHACRWVNGRTPVDLGYLSGLAHVSEARAVSADGRVIVGAIGNRQEKQLAFRWTADGGLEALGDLPGAAAAVSADGSVIVGTSNGEAFRWDARHGKQPLAELLAAAGVDLADLHLDSAIAVSADGSTILGTGTYPLRGPQLAFGWRTPRTVVWLSSLPSVPNIATTDVPSEYLPESAKGTPPVLGKRKLVVRNSRLFASGVALGNVSEVTYRIGSNGPFKIATGTNYWRFTARLSPGPNPVTILARGPGGDSKPVQTVIISR